jgi:hypothetical protein
MFTQIIPTDTEVRSVDFVDITVKKIMDDDDSVIEKDTNTDPSSSVKLDEVGGGSSSVAADAQDKALLLDNELRNLSLGRKTKNSKAKIKKPNTVSQYKPEQWMLQDEDKKMPGQLNLAIVSNRTCLLHNCLSSILNTRYFFWFLHFAYLYEYVKLESPARLVMLILGNQPYVVDCCMSLGGFQKSKCIKMRKNQKKRSVLL